MSFAEEPAILVCCAVREEAAFLKPDKRLDVLVTGMGRDNAEKQVHRRLKSADYDLILTCGFAGGLNPYLSSGTVVYDCDADESLNAALLAARACPATFHCSDRVAVTVAEKERLWEQTRCDAVEMESQIIRAIARAHEIPSATVRVISDSATEDLPIDFNALMTADQRLNFFKLAGAIMMSPSRIRGLMRLQGTCRAAAKNLATTIEGFAGHWKRQPGS
jgi:adenosylhomocysteine nucleosidase